MSGHEAKLPDAERDVLACLNRLNEATVRQLRDELQPIRVMEAASVMTLLKRLESKGLVRRRKADKGKAFVFSPTAESSKACRGLMAELFHRVFGGDTMAFMSSFFETRKPTAAEIQQMQQLLDELKERQDSERTGK